MNLNQALAHLDTLTYDQLGIAYDIADERVGLATSRLARNRAMLLRQRVEAEANRRGAIVRKHYDGRTMVGPPSFFEPINER